MSISKMSCTSFQAASDAATVASVASPVHAPDPAGQLAGATNTNVDVLGLMRDNAFLHQKANELTVERDTLRAQLTAANRPDTWMRDYNEKVIRKNDDLGHENQALREEVAFLQAEVETLHAKIRRFHGEMEAAHTTISALNDRILKIEEAAAAEELRTSRLWLRAVGDALEDLAICLAAGVTQEELQKSNCHGFGGLNSVLRRCKRDAKMIAIRAASKDTGDTILRALLTLIDNGIANDDIWETVAEKVAYNPAQIDTIVQETCTSFPDGERERIFLPAVGAKAQVEYHRYVSSETQEAMRLVKTSGCFIGHPQEFMKIVSMSGGLIARPSFSDISAQNLEDFVNYTADPAHKLGMLSMVASFRQMYAAYEAMTTPVSGGAGAMPGI